MPTKVFNHGWSTENEKDWLKKLGAHRKNGYLKSKVLKSIWKPVQREPTGAISTKRRFLLMPKNFWKKKPKR
jgi:hypothetical protein